MNTKHKVDNAIITAAGFGSRFVPLSYDMPRGLLEVLGERLVDVRSNNFMKPELPISLLLSVISEKNSNTWLINTT